MLAPAVWWRTYPNGWGKRGNIPQAIGDIFALETRRLLAFGRDAVSFDREKRDPGRAMSGAFMFDHVKFGVRDFAASKAFYLKALAPLGVVVVEAAKQSGSLITARLALDQDREVFAVPGSPLDQRSEGGNHLIQQGARLITNAADIIEGLGAIDDPEPAPLLEPDWDVTGGFEEDEPSTDDRARLLEALSVAPVSIDALIAATGLSVSAVQMLLLELDLQGRIEWSTGQLVALKE